MWKADRAGDVRHRRTEAPIFPSVSSTRTVSLPRALVFALALAACGDASRRGAPSRAEFLVAAGDSTYWVRGDDSGIHVRRGAPILLARYGGRFHEVYLADDDRSFRDAVFVGQRLYRRDLHTGDSTLVFADTLVPTLAEGYAREHPWARRLRDDEDAREDAETQALAEVDVVEMHGPLLSYEYHTDLHLPSGEAHATRRGVLDLREGTPMSLDALFGSEIAARVTARGRLAFDAALDSLLFSRGDERVRRAVAAVAGLAFDPRSFALADVAGEPAVAFLASGTGGDADGITLPLAPIALGHVPWWDTLATDGLPDAAPDSLSESWRRRRYELVARYHVEADTVVLTVRDSVGEWRVGRVPAPVHRVFFVDEPPLGAEERRALLRAFDEAALYDEGAIIVAAPGPRRDRFVAASLPSARIVARRGRARPGAGVTVTRATRIRHR